MITFETLLQLPPLRKMNVIAGHGGLSREIKVVSVIDAPDSHKWLKGGEFILTSAYMFGEDEQFLELMLTNLIEAGSSGLGIKRGRHLKAVPANVIATANKHQFPLIEIPFSFGWSNVIAVYYELLYSGAEDSRQAAAPGQKEQKNTDNIDKAQLYREFVPDLFSGQASPADIRRFEKLRPARQGLYTGAAFIHSEDNTTVLHKLSDAMQSSRLARKGQANCYIIEEALENEAIALLEVQLDEGNDALLEWQSTMWEDLEYYVCGQDSDSIAVGRFYPQLVEVVASLREAKEAYAIGRALCPAKHCYPYTLLSAFSALQDADPRKVDLSYAELLANTKAGVSVDGILTLETYIDCGTYKKTAEALFIHENTLRYRLQKISDLLHLDLEDAVAMQAVLLQIKLWRLNN
jgi:purine catabolism regulator